MEDETVVIGINVNPSEMRSKNGIASVPERGDWTRWFDIVVIYWRGKISQNLLSNDFTVAFIYIGMLEMNILILKKFTNR